MAIERKLNFKLLIGVDEAVPGVDENAMPGDNEKAVSTRSLTPISTSEWSKREIAFKVVTQLICSE